MKEEKISRAIMYSKRMDEPRVCPSSILSSNQILPRSGGHDYIKMPNVMKGENGDLEVCDLRLDAADSILCSVNIILGVVARSQSTEEDEDGDNDQAEDQNFAHGWAGGAKLGPGAVGLRQVFLYLLLAKLEPEHSKKGDGIAEHLEVGDHGSPDEDRGDNEEDILQDTAECQDETRGLSNLSRD